MGFGPFCVVLDFVPPFSRTGARLVDSRSSASMRDRRSVVSCFIGHLFAEISWHRIRGNLIRFLQGKIGRPPRRQPRKKIEGETKMKVKSSRGIAVACCTASLVSASKAALSQKLRIRNMGLAALYCTLLLFSGAPAWADPCNAPTVGTPAGSFTSDPTGSCGFVITITGGSGSLAATILPGSSGPYDGAEDQLVGIQNTAGPVFWGSTGLLVQLADSI